MDWKSALTKLLLQLGIGLLTKFVPFLGTLLGGPLGWLAGWLLGKATDWLYTLIERYLKFKEIDREVAARLITAKIATDALNALEGKKDVPAQEKNAAMEAFRNAVRDLGRVKL